MKPPSRLSQQGFINLHRKLIIRLIAIALGIYLFYGPNPWHLTGDAARFTLLAGLLLIFLGIIIRGMATLSIGGNKDRMIVKTELYSTCRNPLYFASFLMSIGVGMVSARPDFAVLIGTAYLAVFYPMMRNEAAFLRERFDDFADYEKSVPLFIPNPMLWKQRDSFEINFKLHKRTLLDASLVFLAIPLVWLPEWLI